MTRASPKVVLSLAVHIIVRKENGQEICQDFIFLMDFHDRPWYWTEDERAIKAVLFYTAGLANVG